ncbi:hypothetical protein EVAR_57419_1 [Eumeta japonica]|uniref:Uncharacterized protein n=1 Tax=Eumeta variegata TaxID=151549 RepID=A0A4C1YBY5_EUMVA|nr:hypothetical protein EVAR_57419_1 [Eumeta japonica]
MIVPVREGAATPSVLANRENEQNASNAAGAIAPLLRAGFICVRAPPAGERRHHEQGKRAHPGSFLLFRVSSLKRNPSRNTSLSVCVKVLAQVEQGTEISR